jgi:hypothetical protein
VQRLVASLGRVGSDTVERRVLFPCPACGAPHVLGENTHQFICRVCDHVTEFYQCRGCRTTFASQYEPKAQEIVEGKTSGGPSLRRCGGCGNTIRTRALRPGRVSGASADWGPTKKFYESFGLDFNEVVQFKGRRVIFGEVLLTTGLGKLDRGLFMVSFDQEAMFIHQGDGHKVPYEKIRLLEILSRDEVTATPPRDIVATLASDSLATKPVSESESVLAVAWEDGSFVVLNRMLRPEELAIVLEAYTSRVLDGPTNAG